MLWPIVALFLLMLVVLALYDITQRQHAILRNFPIIGHFRYWLEAVGPELRQYIVTGNDEERPFSRDQRRWVYASAKQQNNYFGFGTDNDLEMRPNHLIIKHSAFPAQEPHKDDPAYDPTYAIPAAKVIGAHRGRAKAFRPNSVINVSAMSFGSLSWAAVEAINRGCEIAGCMQNTGEGGVSSHHLQGGELIWQIGTGYFGCRDEQGNFSLAKLLARIEKTPQIRMIEIKLSQGAKPGIGGILPSEKVTPEIAEIRGVPLGKDVISPNGHSAFHNVDSMLDFVEQIADATGLPVGIKSAVGEEQFWIDLADQMASTKRGVDFITVDGGEGGTGAGPLVFSDHVALPFKLGFSRVYRIFAERNIQDTVIFIGSGKLGFPEATLFAFGLGCDLVAVAREAMLAIGCIQAQRCHTGHCPTGVATQTPWLVRGLDPTLKAARLANYVMVLRKEVLRLCHACGVTHPALICPEHFAILDDRYGAVGIQELFHYGAKFAVPSAAEAAAVAEIMAKRIAN
ncbi:MAG: FMN-binding glutamate synthase family protein [Caldilineaceae bacterium]